jgi:predicted DNA-binding transcriptional regulator YafY
VATNKHAIIRYQTLDKCFSNPGRRYYINDLIEACNKSINGFTGIDIEIKRRQIFEDIKFMESAQGWNVPLAHLRDGHKVYYRYSEKSFSINNQPLNEREGNQLKEALLTLSRFKGMPQFAWVDEISARLDSGLGLSHNNDKIIEFDQNDYLKGLEHISPIYNSILYKKVLNIAYKSFKQETIQSFILHPYFLKQYNNRWYVFGKSDDSQFIINLALDRIASIQEIKKAFIPNTSIDFSEYFEDIIGVTLSTEAQIQNILLKVNNSLLPYITTKPIHGSQKVKEKGATYTVISLQLIPNYELESLILSYGEGLEILEPQTLRETIKKRIELISNNYKNNSADKLHN